MFEVSNTGVSNKEGSVKQRIRTGAENRKRKYVQPFLCRFCIMSVYCNSSPIPDGSYMYDL